MNKERLHTRLFWTFALASLLAGFGGQLVLALEPAAFAGTWFRQGWVLLAVHLTTLGFLVLLVMAVLTQFLPVLFGRPLYSLGLAAAGMAAFAVSALGFWIYLGFARFTWLGWLAGSGLLLGLFLYLLQAGLSLHGAVQQPMTRLTLASAGAYLALAALLGFLMAPGLSRSPVLPGNPLQTLALHAHLALFGFATLVVYAVSYQLLPMFNLAKGYPEWPGWTALVLAHAGLLAMIAARFSGLPSLWAWAALGLAGSALAYGMQVILLMRKALRQKRDASLWTFLQALGFFYVAAVMGLRLALGGPTGPGFQAAYIWLLLFGWIGGVIFSQAQKIFYFLSWFDRFSSRIGRFRVPRAEALLWPGMARALAAFHLLATLLGLAGLLRADPGQLRLAGMAGCACFLSLGGLLIGCRVRGRAEPLSSPLPTAA